MSKYIIDETEEMKQLREEFENKSKEEQEREIEQSISLEEEMSGDDNDEKEDYYMDVYNDLRRVVPVLEYNTMVSLLDSLKSFQQIDDDEAKRRINDEVYFYFYRKVLSIAKKRKEKQIDVMDLFDQGMYALLKADFSRFELEEQYKELLVEDICKDVSRLLKDILAKVEMKENERKAVNKKIINEVKKSIEKYVEKLSINDIKVELEDFIRSIETNDNDIVKKLVTNGGLEKKYEELNIIIKDIIDYREKNVNWNIKVRSILEGVEKGVVGKFLNWGGKIARNEISDYKRRCLGMSRHYYYNVYIPINVLERECIIKGKPFNAEAIADRLGKTVDTAYRYMEFMESVKRVSLDANLQSNTVDKVSYEYYSNNSGMNMEGLFEREKGNNNFFDAVEQLPKDEKLIILLTERESSLNKIIKRLADKSISEEEKEILVEEAEKLKSEIGNIERSKEIIDMPQQMKKYISLFAMRKIQVYMDRKNSASNLVKVAENSPTWILKEAVNNYLKKITGDGNIVKYIDSKDKEELKKLLTSNIDEAPTLGDYIYPYVYAMLNMDIEYKEYDIRTKIRQALNESGMEKSDNGLSGLVRTQTIMDNLEKKAICCTRKYIFSLAIGLNISLEDVSMLLTKVIMDSDFNFKDFREVIYYWVLSTKTEKRGVGVSKYNLVCNYISRYLRGEFANSKYGGYLWVRADEQTRVLGKRFKTLSSEEEFSNYLHSIGNEMSHIEENYHTKSIYEEYITKLPKYDEGDDGKVIAGNISYYRKLAATEFEKTKKYTGETLLPKCYLDEIFIYALGNTKNKNKDFTEYIIDDNKHFHQSGSKKSTPTRSELLMLIFLFHSSKFIVCDDERSRKSTIHAFKQDLNMVMEERGMYNDLYLRNMFDFFIQICWLHQNPYEYFCASWEEALRED